MEPTLEWGTALKVIRAARSMNQSELAEAAEIGQSHMCLLESGKRSASLAVMDRLCGALSISQSDLARIAENPAEALGIPNEATL